MRLFALALILIAACAPDCERDLVLGDPITLYTDEAPHSCDKDIAAPQEWRGDRQDVRCVEIKDLYRPYNDTWRAKAKLDGMWCFAVVKDGKVFARYTMSSY